MTSLIMLLLLEADNVKSGVCLWFREKLLCTFNAHLLYKHFIGNTRSMLFRAPVCCQTAWRLFWCGFHWMLKTFLWDNNPCWHYCTARFFAAHQYINMEGDFAGFCDVMGKPLKSTALIVMLLKPVRQNQADIINLKVVIKRWQTAAIKTLKRHGKKIHVFLYCCIQHGLLTHAKLGPWIQAVDAKLWPYWTICIPQHKSRYRPSYAFVCALSRLVLDWQNWKPL